MNESRTRGNSDTQLTRVGSPSVRGAQAWSVRDNDDKPWGPFTTAEEARVWAQKKWPNVPEYDEDNYDGHGCWDVEALWTPTD